MVSKSKLSDYKIKKLLTCFAKDLTASQTSQLTNINRNTVNRYYKLFREKIALFCEKESIFSGEIELDESYFGGKYKGKRGRGSENKIPVFGILKRNGKVYTQVIPDAKAKTLIKIIRNKVETSSKVYTDKFKSYDSLILNGYDHYRINHSERFSQGRTHINGIESFWSFCKRRLGKFNGLRKKDYLLHIKECEFRFNYRNDNMYNKIIGLLKSK